MDETGLTEGSAVVKIREIVRFMKEQYGITVTEENVDSEIAALVANWKGCAEEAAKVVRRLVTSDNLRAGRAFLAHFDSLEAAHKRRQS